jgi:hypothetical protein
MVRLLSSIILVVISFEFSSAQSNSYIKDYKNREQFKDFFYRRKEISKWQITQLKTGAIMVRLRTNARLIDELRKSGKSQEALLKEKATFQTNKTIVRAYLKNYTFSKVYFFYSDKSDTLMKGTRSGIFLDSNLTIDPKIIFNEHFYLLVDRDACYNSSVGFVEQDSAEFVKESGNLERDCIILLKTKYGHQLKPPFPYKINGVFYDMYFSPSNTSDKNYDPDEDPLMKRQNKMLNCVKKFNIKLTRYYESNKNYTLSDPELKPFLY